MIIKYLALVAVLAFIYFAFFRKKITKKEIKDSETMVECAECSTFLSTKEAIIKNNNFYCCKECAGAKR